MTQEQTAPRVAVVLLSYNRPTMLELAYQSIKGADAVLLVDDGSDTFDPLTWIRERDREWLAEHSDTRVTSAILGEQKTVEERLSKPTLGKLINTALRYARDLAHCDAVTYLCDDDLFAPGWIPAIRKNLTDTRKPHVIRGCWLVFDDPLENGPLLKPPAAKTLKRVALDWRQTTTGNFAHRIECFIDEGLRWSEEAVAVHDNVFLWRMHEIHPLHKREGAITTRTLAGYRRNHPWNMANYTIGDQYGIGADRALARGALE